MIYRIDPRDDVLEIGFGSPARNSVIVKAVKARLDEMIQSGELQGGSIIKINGPSSLPVITTIAHAVANRYETVAVFDPKVGQYVVAISHGGAYNVGDLID